MVVMISSARWHQELFKSGMGGWSSVLTEGKSFEEFVERDHPLLWASLTSQHLCWPPDLRLSSMQEAAVQPCLVSILSTVKTWGYPGVLKSYLNHFWIVWSRVPWGSYWIVLNFACSCCCRGWWWFASLGLSSFEGPTQKENWAHTKGK